jgi:hypothetical protein
MRLAHVCPLQVLASTCMAAAKEIIVTVGGNTTGNGLTTFVPQSVVAELGDVVKFDCRLISCS